MNKLTLLASVLLVSAVLAQCPVDYTIPNLVAGISDSTQIRCKSQSPSPRATHPRTIGTLWQTPCLRLPQSQSVFLTLFSPPRLLSVFFRTPCLLHISHPDLDLTHCLHLRLHHSSLDQGEIQLLGFGQQRGAVGPL